MTSHVYQPLPSWMGHHPRNYTPWSIAEDNALRAHMQAKMSLTQISEAHLRSVKGITSRLALLNLKWWRAPARVTLPVTGTAQGLIDDLELNLRVLTGTFNRLKVEFGVTQPLFPDEVTRG
jgi:hypothetical protein